MLSAGAETLLRMVGWTFLPDFGARLLLRTFRQLQASPPPFLGIKPRQPPPLNSPGYALQQRISFSIIIFAYLLYTAIQAYLQAPPNFYELLGVLPNVDEGTLKTAFRNFARFNHPDRVGPSGEARFIAARDAFDTLKSSTRRFAYDRFGPDVIGWAADCTTTTDYLERGLMASCGFYIVSAVAMVLYAIFGQSGFGAFWRYNLFFTLVSLELLLILSPQYNVLASLFPTRVAYQHIRFLHQVFISLSIAITRIGPAVLPSFSGGTTTQAEWEQERTVLHNVARRITEIAARLDREISRMIHAELKAAHGEVEELPAEGATAAASASMPNAEPTNTSSTPSPAKRQSIAQKEDTLSPLASRTAKPNRRQAVFPSSSAALAGLGGMELNDVVMRHLSKEVEDMVIEKNLRRHPMLARIWKEGVAAGRASYEKEREDRIFGMQNQSMTQSQLTAVDLSMGQQQSGGNKLGESSWKEGYIQRRARSEEHSPSPSPSLPPRLFQGPTPSLTNTPPPRPLRNLSQFSSEASHSELHRRSSSSSSNMSSLPRASSVLARSVEAEKARLREAALERLTMSPGPDLNLIAAAAAGNAKQPGIRRVGSGGFSNSPVYLGTPTPNEGQ